MNEEPPTPFDTIGDAPVEARIVAWVLGEASAFEATELERLCEERPELLVFRRRMRALHGLLTEAEAAETDHSWKLPPEKRKALDEIFGVETVVQLDARKELRVRRYGRRAMLAIAACVVITFFVVRMTPWKHVAEATLEVKPRSLGASSSSQLTPQFFGTELEKIKSRNSLEKVVDNLDLAKRWNMDKESALKRVKDSIETRNVPGTDLLSIKVREASERDAQEITQEVVQSYKKYRSSIETREAEKGLFELKRAVRDQEDKVEEMRKVLATIVRTKGIVHKGQDSSYGQSAVDEETAKNDTREEAIKRGLDAQDYADAKREFETEQQLLQSMKLKQINETITYAMTEDSVVVHEMTPPVKSEKAVKSLTAPAASGVKAQVAQQAGRLKGGIDILGGSEFHLDLKRSDKAKETESLPAVRGMIVDKENMDERLSSLATNAKSEPQQPTSPPTTSSLRYARSGSGSGRGIGGAGIDAGNPPHGAMADELSQVEGEKASGLTSDNQRPPAEPLAKAKADQDRDAITLSGGNTYTGEITTSAGTLGAELTYGLRSGDQAIDRNSIDAILNNPNRVADGGKTAKGIDSIPPVIADRESRIAGEPNRPPEGAAAVAGALPSWGGHEGKLAEGDEKSGTGTLPGSDSSTLSALEGLGRSNSARTREQTQTVDQVRRNLYTAEGNYNLGKYDDAKKAYEDTLRIDPYNSAARRGLEQVEVAKSDYYRAAYDHTRAELLGQVDSAWELSVPAEGGTEFFSEVAKDSDASLHTVDKDRKQRGGIEYELYTGYTPEYLFRGVDLSPKEKSKPAPVDLVELMEEIPASENPYSTFSLNISDASFQLAKAALAKGERPDPASIKPEQFYNAVDYGDPAPASNEPVAATVEQSAHPIIPGRNLVRVALRTGSAGRSAAQPLRLTLLVDQSGSMVREDRRAAMEHALAQLGGLLTKADLVTVIGFSRSPHLLADAMPGDQAAKLGDLVNQTASEGGTNLEEAMKLGAEKAAQHQLAGAQNRIVLFTDGAANLGDAKPERLAELVKSYRQKGLAFDIAGIGTDGLNDRLLSELARNGNGRYYVVGNEKNDSFARQLAGAFRPAAENVKVQVNFNPQRVGKYKLIGFEKDRLKTEDFRNDAVDAAELAAEEAGVAIYQVEPLAEGTGEIGEVSVRFRDTASQEMVERTWTIPFASQATAFDRATPSMQLAGLSLLAAEKLKGGPMADAIDFKQLTGPSAFVKQFYGGSTRVGDMLRVIDSLR